MKEILAKSASLYPSFQILVGGCDHAHVDMHGLMAPHAIEIAFGQYAQQPGLQLGRHIADLIQKQSSAVGLLEAPRALTGGSRERSAFMSE